MYCVLCILYCLFCTFKFTIFTLPETACFRMERKEESNNSEMQFNNLRGHDGFMEGFQPDYEEEKRKCFAGEGGFTGGENARPMFINQKQIYWIKKRKIRREMLDSMMVAQKSNYLHESRHRHAMKRLRAPSGRFLTKEEAAALKYEENNAEQMDGVDLPIN